MDNRSQAQRVVDRFRDHRKALEGRFGKSQVKTWLRQGTIRESYWLDLLVLAHDLDVALTPLDFVAHVAEAFVRRMVDPRAVTSGALPASSAVPA